MKKANYHTHTWRCKHAKGTEREYIEQAIEAGMEVLGFSDHVPWPFKDYVSPIRMDMSQLPEYFETLLSLREAYRGEIEIKIGFETEYLPYYWEELQKELKKYPVDYMIMGQHYLGWEHPSNFMSRVADNEKMLEGYVDTVLEGLGTGAFAYLAHPDLPKFTGDRGFYKEQMERLCLGCRKLGIPMEINMAGVYENVHYPSEEFWRIAAKVGTEAVIGYDAHSAAMLQREEVYRQCLLWAKGMGVSVREDFRI